MPLKRLKTVKLLLVKLPMNLFAPERIDKNKLMRLLKSLHHSDHHFQWSNHSIPAPSCLFMYIGG
jgi:hypothetical protein